MKKGKEEWSKYWGMKQVSLWQSGRFSVTPTRKNLFSLFEKIPLPGDAKILDVGCGSGSLTRFWKERGYDVIGLDISDNALEIAAKKGLNCVKGDVTKGLAFEDNTFDLVYSDGLLEHFINPKPILEEIFRVSRKYVLTTVPRKCLYKVIHNILFRPPKEYKREDSEWINLHKEFNPKSIRVGRIKFGLLTLLCEKVNDQ